jgi:peptidoglycan hydrolase-like protein with peptidoglycan-binding domain
MSIKKTWFSVVKPALVATITVLLAAGAVNADADVQKAQRLLNALGFDAGSVDGQWGKKSETALSEFLIEQGQEFDGNLDQNELDVLQAAATAKNISTKPLSGVEIENRFSVLALPPVKPGTIWQKYSMASWLSADFNNDGLEDLLYFGTMIPENWNTEGATTGEACGKGQACKGMMPSPTMLFKTKEGKFIETDVIVDNRDKPGQSLSRQTLVADFNNDKMLDFFIADHGYGTHKGFRDSYFLSQPDGTWLESSETHLSDPNLVIFDHGAAAGDIDGDGDLDIVLTELKNSLTCWMNSGDGQLSKKKCGSVNAFAIELGDIDGDGDLDLVHAGNEVEFSSPTGIAWNDGDGNFKGGAKLPKVKDWIGVPELSVWDLDADGDLDIVLSRNGELYVGTGLQILENTGNDDFISTFYPIVVAPTDFVPQHEGNEWNNFVSTLRFSDVNKDDLVDVILINNDDPKNVKVRGGVMINMGEMQFKFTAKGQEGNPITDLPESDFTTNEYKIILKDETQIDEREKSISTDASRKFEKVVSQLESKPSDASGMIALSRAILMERSGALVKSYRNYSHPSYLRDKFTVDVLIEFGSIETVVSICVEFQPSANFTGVYVSLTDQVFEGLFAGKVTADRPDCMVGSVNLKNVGKAERALIFASGIEDILWDLQYNWQHIYSEMEGIPLEEREKVLSTFH